MNFVKIKGSDVRLEYPQKRIDSLPDCQCEHPIHPHFHFEDDLTKEPIKRKITPKLLENNGDGIFTLWSLSLFGAVGHQGTLSTGMTVEELSTDEDFKEKQRIEKMIEDGKRRSQLMFDIYKTKIS